MINYDWYILINKKKGLHYQIFDDFIYIRVSLLHPATPVARIPTTHPKSGSKYMTQYDQIIKTIIERYGEQDY